MTPLLPNDYEGVFFVGVSQHKKSSQDDVPCRKRSWIRPSWRTNTQFSPGIRRRLVSIRTWTILPGATSSRASLVSCSSRNRPAAGCHWHPASAEAEVAWALKCRSRLARQCSRQTFPCTRNQAVGRLPLGVIGCACADVDGVFTRFTQPISPTISRGNRKRWVSQTQPTLQDWAVAQ